VPASTVVDLARILGADVSALCADRPPPEPEIRPLRALRRAAGMTWREAAAHLDLSVSTLARYESGERRTPVAVLRRMAVVYRRPPGQLLRFSSDVTPLPPGYRWRPEDLPQAVQALRTAAGLSKVELGRLLGRSGQAVRAWETGRTRPTAATCRRLEAVFGLPAGKLPR
jgi:transcriptional regulator with XRE-family HTH domain